MAPERTRIITIAIIHMNSGSDTEVVTKFISGTKRKVIHGIWSEWGGWGRHKRFYPGTMKYQAVAHLVGSSCKHGQTGKGTGQNILSGLVGQSAVIL